MQKIVKLCFFVISILLINCQSKPEKKQEDILFISPDTSLKEVRS